MVTKTPKKQAHGRRQFHKRNTLLGVYIPKLDENVFEAYRNRLIERFSENTIPAKEERTCIFSSEINLDDSEHGPCNESSGSCQCNYCLQYHEMKLQNYDPFLDPTEDQENVGCRNPYLCDLVQGNAQLYPYCQENIPAPPAVEMRDAETQTPSKKYKYTCECSSQFNNLYYFELHKLTHASELYECAFCNATFTDEKDLGFHIVLHTNKNYFECIECECVFGRKKHLINHIKRTHKKYFECGECEAQFSTDTALLNHKKTHTSSGKMIHVFRRDKASIKPTTQVIVEETKSANVYENAPVKAPRFFQCKKCHLQFRSASTLARHNNIHNRSAAKFSHVCDGCDARFRTKSNLAWHKRYVHKE